LIFDTSTISAAGEYAGKMTHVRSHIDSWADLQAKGLAPRDFDYDELPRGRIIFEPKACQFMIYADQCILREKKLVAEVLAELNLPPTKTTTSTDLHYRCTDCLKRSE
jgi:hypothetical protein